MADFQAVSSDESLKDWTLVEQEGLEKIPRGSRSPSTSSVSEDEITVQSLENVHKDGTTPFKSTEQTATVIGKEATCDSDLDFVRIDDENDDQLNDWITASIAGQHMEQCQHERTEPNVEDADADWSSECTEADSDEESECDSDDQESDEVEDDATFPVNEELPDDYPQRYDRTCHMYTHKRNNNVNDWLTTALCVVLAIASGVAIGHFFGSETVAHDRYDEPLYRDTVDHQPPDRPASTALSDVQKGQVEILKQLQEMIRAQGDLKQRVVVLEDENRDLRFRLLENRKRCTRILHKSSTVTSVESIVPLNYSSDNTPENQPPKLAAPTRLFNLFHRTNPPQSRSASKKTTNLPLTISAVVVPSKRSKDVISTRFSAPESLHNPPFRVEKTHFTSLPFPRFEPYYYPFLDLDVISRAAAAIDTDSSAEVTDSLPEFVLIDSSVIPLRDLLNDRKTKTFASLAAPASAVFSPYNFSFESGYQERVNSPVNRPRIKLVKLAGSEPVRGLENEHKSGNVKQEANSSKWAKTKETINDIKKVIKTDRDRIKENRKKFDEEYAEFKARWKNTSNENNSRKEGKIRDHGKEGCKKGKPVEDCEEGYCYTRPKKSHKYEKKGGGNKFWDSLPHVVRKHSEKSAKMERILKEFGKEVISSKIFQKVVEEIPARLKMSTEWWECQWQWWQNFARNQRASSYGDCAGYLTSWQNRHKQNTNKRKDQDHQIFIGKKTKKSVFDRWNEDETEENSWYTKRASARERQRGTRKGEHQRGPKDWIFIRATLRERERAEQREMKSGRPTNSSWWFFQRARNRNARRQHYSNDINGDFYPNAVPGDPIYTFLKDRAVWYGSNHP